MSKSPASNSHEKPPSTPDGMNGHSESTSEYAAVAVAAPPSSVFVDHKALNKIVATMNEVRALVQANTGAGLESSIKIPSICVVGEQSAGKSSLLQQLLGVPLFPRSDGTCTRSPIAVEVIPMNADDLCNDVIPRAGSGAVTKDLSKKKYEKNTFMLRFGPEEKEQFSFDPSDVQRYITEIWKALKDTMSNTEIRIRMFSTALPALAFVDLPGLLMTVNALNSEETRDAIEKMSEAYASKEHNVCLVVHLSATDFQVGKGVAVARRFDKTGKRTIVALSKMDRCAETMISRLLSGEGNPWGDEAPRIFGVRCPAVSEDHDAFAAFKGCKTIAQAQNAEIEYFNSKEVFRPFSEYLGTQNLNKRLSELLAEKLHEQFMPVKEEVLRLLEQAEAKRRLLGDPSPSDEPNRLSRFNEIMWDLQQAMTALIEGGSAGAELEGGALLCHHFEQKFMQQLSQFEDKSAKIAATDADTLKRIENQIRNSHGREQYLPFPTKEVVMRLVKQVFGNDFADLRAAVSLTIEHASQIVLRLIDPLLDPSNPECPSSVAHELKVRKSLSTFIKNNLRQFLLARSNVCKERLSQIVAYSASAFGLTALNNFHAILQREQSEARQPSSLLTLDSRTGAKYSTKIAHEKVKADCKEMLEVAPKCFHVEVVSNLFKDMSKELVKSPASLKSVYHAMNEDPAIAKQRADLESRIRTLKTAYEKLIEAED